MCASGHPVAVADSCAPFRQESFSFAPQDCRQSDGFAAPPAPPRRSRYLALEPRTRELELMHRWVDSGSGIGHVVTGMRTRASTSSSRATTSAAGGRRSTRPGWGTLARERDGHRMERTPWHAVQGAAREALRRGLSGEPSTGELIWEPLGLARAIRLLHNPRYAELHLRPQPLAETTRWPDDPAGPAPGAVAGVAPGRPPRLPLLG